MLQIQRIESLDLPELAPYRTMRYQLDHRQQGIFVAESAKVARRLIESDWPVISLVLMEKWLPAFEKHLAHRKENIRVFVAEKELLDKLTGYPTYQGVMALGKIPPRQNLESVLAKTSRPLLLVAADGIVNAQNMGALIRNCAAFSVNALLVGETCCSPFMRRSVGGSMGTIFRLPALELSDLAGTLRQLHARGIRCLAAHAHTNQKALPQAGFSHDCCIVLGSEGEGIRPMVLEQCDEHIAIPMPPDVDSLNVGSATAIFLYEAARQRGTMKR